MHSLASQHMKKEHEEGGREEDMKIGLHWALGFKKSFLSVTRTGSEVSEPRRRNGALQFLHTSLSFITNFLRTVIKSCSLSEAVSSFVKESDYLVILSDLIINESSIWDKLWPESPPWRTERGRAPTEHIRLIIAFAYSKVKRAATTKQNLRRRVTLCPKVLWITSLFSWYLILKLRTLSH